MTDDNGAADLLLVDHASGGSLLDVTSDTLLAAAAARADITDNANTLPLGRSLYGYWASKDALTALLGDDPVTALQGRPGTEWRRLRRDTLRLAGCAESCCGNALRPGLHPCPRQSPTP